MPTDPLVFQGLGALAQGFLAGRQAKQERLRQEQEFEFRQQQALAEANRAERAAKAQELQNQLALLSFGQRAFQEGTAGPGMEGFIRSQLPESLTTVAEQKPVSEILPTTEMPAVRPPMQTPLSYVQRTALQNLQVLSDRENLLAQAPIPDEERAALQERIAEERRKSQEILYGEPSQVLTKGLETRPRGESFALGRPLPVRPAGVVEQRRPAPSLFQAPPTKPLKPEEDPLVQTQKEVELNFRSGRMAPEEMQKYYKLKSEYQRTNNKDTFLQGLQTLRFRERPVTERAGGTQQTMADYRLLLGYQDVVRDTDQSINEIQDNLVAQQKAAADLKEQIGAVDANLIMTPIAKKERKDALQKELGKINNEIFRLNQQKAGRLKYSNTIKESINELEKKVGLPGEVETEPETEVPEDLSQASVEQLLKIMSGQ